jgi:hypothetical protein
MRVVRGGGGRRVFVYLNFVFLGVSTTVFLHSMRKDLQAYNLSLTELQLFEIVPFLPWCYKCFFALFSEKIPIFGQHQRPYLVGANFFSAALCFFLLFPDLTKGQYLSIFFIQQNCAAWADCVLDTMKVEESVDESREDAAVSGRFGTRTQMARTFGRWIGRSSGPMLWQLMTSKGVYGILSLAYVFPMLLACFSEEKEKFFQRRRRLKNSFEEGQLDLQNHHTVKCFNTSRVLWKYLRNRTLVTVLVFVLLSTLLIPSPATPLFFFLNDIAQLTSWQQSIMNSSSEISQFWALWVFDMWIRKWSISNMYIVFAMMQAFTIIFTMLLVVEIPGTQCPRMVESNETMILDSNSTCYFYEAYNVPPFPLAMGETIIGDALDQLQSLPLTLVTSQLCTGQLSGTMFTFIYSLQNLVGIISMLINSQWISLLGIDHYKFDNLFILILVGGGCWLLISIMAYLFLPRLVFSELDNGDYQPSVHLPSLEEDDPPPASSLASVHPTALVSSSSSAVAAVL